MVKEIQEALLKIGSFSFTVYIYSTFVNTFVNVTISHLDTRTWKSLKS